MKVGLIDVDYRKFPNIALMKIAAHHKAKGDDVEWYLPFSDRYDVVINADKVIKGGSGYAIKLINGKEFYDKSKDQPLPNEIEHMYPDYSLYGITDTAYGFLTRGCPRGCDFCIVARKEGQRSVKVADLNEFWNGQKNIVLCDPNILACKDWADLLGQLAKSKANIDFNQGLDARLLTEEKIDALNNCKVKEIHFAWDRYQDRDKILPKLELYANKAKRRPNSHNSIVYTIVNFDTTFEQDLERIYTLRELGYWAYVMIYDKEHCDDKYKKLQRWVNNRFIFAKCEKFEFYKI